MPSVADFEHPAWLSLGGAVAGYLIVLAVLTVLLFALPYLAFTAL
jgi:hypothetical protein